MFARVLLPINQTKEEIEMVRKAIELAKNYNSKLIMVSVIPSQNSASLKTKTSTDDGLKKTKRLLEQNGIRWDFIERKGNPTFVICDIADELNIDVIVMGIKAKIVSNSAKNIVSRVIELAPCPVLVVP